MNGNAKHTGSGFSLYYAERAKADGINIRACSKEWRNLSKADQKKYIDLSSECNKTFFAEKKKKKNNLIEEGVQTNDKKSRKGPFAPDRLMMQSNVSSYSYLHRPSPPFIYYFHSPSQPNPPPSYSKNYFFDSEQVDYCP